MKTLLTAALTSLTVTGMALTVAQPLAAQDRGSLGLSFDMGIGMKSVPKYEGSDETNLDSWPILRNLSVSTGDGDDGPAQGFYLGPDFALIKKRGTGPSAPEPLRGLDSVGYGVELGAKAGYRAGPMRFYGAARKAVGGHHGVTGELGVAMTMQPADRWTVKSALEAQYGDRKFMEAYFAVSPDEAIRSGHPEYDLSGGVKAHALSVEARYDLNQDWAVLGHVQAKRLTGDAADSPIVKDRNQFWVGLGVTRHFNFRF